MNLLRLSLLTLLTIGCASQQLSTEMAPLEASLPAERVLKERGEVLPGPTPARPLLSFTVDVYEDGETPTPRGLPFAELPVAALQASPCLEAVFEDTASVSVFDGGGVRPVAALALTTSGEAWWMAYHAERGCLVGTPWASPQDAAGDAVLLDLSVAVSGARMREDGSVEPGTPSPRLMDSGEAPLGGAARRVVLGEEGLRVEAEGGEVLETVSFALMPFGDPEQISRGPAYYEDAVLDTAPEIVRALEIEARLVVEEHPAGSLFSLSYEQLLDAESGKDGIRIETAVLAKRVWLWGGEAFVPLEHRGEGRFASNGGGERDGDWRTEVGQERALERWWPTPHGVLSYTSKQIETASEIHEGCRFLEEERTLIWTFDEADGQRGVGFVWEANQPPSEGYVPPGCELEP